MHANVAELSRLRGFLTGLLLAAAFIPADASLLRAATIRVEQDGTGDFTSLFEATRAVDDGDTISIGAGTYAELRPLSLGGYDFSAIGFITASRVHVVGDSRDSVFIGPPGPPAPIPDALEYGFIAWFASEAVSFSTMTVQNVRRGIADTEFAVSVDRCRFVGTYIATLNSGLGEVHISDCEYESSRFGLVCLVRPGAARSVYVERSVFSDCNDAVQLQGVNGFVRDCQFNGGGGAVSALDAAHVLVESSRFFDTSIYGAMVGPGSELWLNRNDFRGTISRAVNVQTGALRGGGNRIAAGSTALLWLASPAALDFQQNHFVNAGGLSVSAGTNSSTPATVSLANNWWGTTDESQIEEWVYHAPDKPETNGLTVTVLPVLPGPVPTESRSVGSMKGRFRGN